MSKLSLPVVVANAEAATFECVYGRGCDGVCCRNGRPSMTPAEQEVVRDNLAKVLPHLRPEARALVEAEGFVSNRQKLGHPMVRVAGGWCVFFNGGCVLHRVGAEDGDVFRYKPSQCALFPLEHDPDKGDWFVRQWGFRGEEWDLFCLNPAASGRLAVESLAGELALAAALGPGAAGGPGKVAPGCRV